MAAFQSFVLCFILGFAAILIPTSTGQLTPDFYKYKCPQALGVIKSVVLRAIQREPRMGASLLRLHFHDCFVNGCDGSVLLDDTANFTGEKTAFPNLNSLRGFDVIDEIKEAVDKACRCNVVSCADIVAVAARDSVAIRIYNDSNIDSSFAAGLKNGCPVSGGDNNTQPLDYETPTRFDTQYFKDLQQSKGLLHSDQELYKGDGSESDQLVKYYGSNPYYFARDFVLP
ncbi:Peroxidase 52 [Morella rubra]|uniref:peroxidase n=1 Tax=Morella rubra TaxID=262757 RepID=A0A6A1WKE2_9ROSI|nr:Peroxidase 52 [Morella rubra]